MCFGESHFDESDKNYLLKNVNFKPSRHGLLLSDANLGKLFSLFKRTVIITKFKKQMYGGITQQTQLFIA